MGNKQVLDFVNTRPVQDGEPMELLKDFGAVLRWFQAAGRLSSGEAGSLRREWDGTVRAQKTTAAMREVRERLRNEILAWEEGGTLGRSTIDELNELMAEHPMRMRLVATASGDSTECGSNYVNPRTCLRPWHTARRHCSQQLVGNASVNVADASCISMTPARRGRDAGAACNYAGIA
jgi:hypothetical protein